MTNIFVLYCFSIDISTTEKVVTLGCACNSSEKKETQIILIKNILESNHMKDED